MDRSFLLLMVAAMAVVALATIWFVKRFIQPPTAAGKRRLTILLCFVAAQFVITTAFALLSVEHVLQPRLLGILGLANFIGSVVILSVVLKRAPVSDSDITREQRVRAVKSTKLLNRNLRNRFDQRIFLHRKDAINGDPGRGSREHPHSDWSNYQPTQEPSEIERQQSVIGEKS